VIEATTETFYFLFDWDRKVQRSLQAMHFVAKVFSLIYWVHE